MRGVLSSSMSVLGAALFGSKEEPQYRRPASPPGHGQRFRALWASGKVDPSFHHISRQVKRREQRKATKRMMKGVRP